VILVLVAGGCCPYDVTGTAEVRRAGVVGRCYVLTSEMHLYRQAFPPSYAVRTAMVDPPSGVSVKGRLKSGTRFRVTKVEQHCQVMEKGGTKYLHEGPYTFARIEGGEFNGLEFETGGVGIAGFRDERAEYAVPCER
jgi:hypothetical protein